VPWCDDCDRYLTPSTLESDGSCPTCGTGVAEPEEDPKAPWHFKVLVALAVLYLAWRFVELLRALL
jgi:uncharacterized paraquat-inducible protein A